MVEIVHEEDGWLLFLRCGGGHARDSIDLEIRRQVKSIVGFQGPRYNPVARKTFLPEADSRKNQRLLEKKGKEREGGKGKQWKKNRNTFGERKFF